MFALCAASLSFEVELLVFAHGGLGSSIDFRFSLRFSSSSCGYCNVRRGALSCYGMAEGGEE